MLIIMIASLGLVSLVLFGIATTTSEMTFELMIGCGAGFIFIFLYLMFYCGC